jgi:glycosyltransferase involved in cell wall biosynthesis
MPVATLPRADVLRAQAKVAPDEAPSSDRSRPHRVLIVSPHFPPINAADHHRVRLALAHLGENGWAAEVLTVRPEDVEGIIDPDLAEALPAGSLVHPASALPLRWTRRLGWGSLAHRAYLHLRSRGSALLATGRFDLVFFSTTQFGVLPLALYWKRRFGVPYVLDFQDEWVSSYYRDHPEVTPPGGAFKYGLSQWLARCQEWAVVQGAAQIVSVSQAYVDRLRASYPQLSQTTLHVLPFGGSPDDFAYLERRKVRQDFFDPADGRQHWVYVGRGGSDMHHAASAFFLAWRQAIDARLLAADGLRVHFIGTSYAPGKTARKSFAPLARAHGLEELVTEHPTRVPYFVALQCLRQADALIVFGSDDEGYTASKIHPYLLAGKPLLAIFREESSVVNVLRATGAGSLVTFAAETSIEQTAQQIFQAWRQPRAFAQIPVMSAEPFSPYSAETMTRRLAEIFNHALGQPASVR